MPIFWALYALLSSHNSYNTTDTFDVTLVLQDCKAHKAPPPPPHVSILANINVSLLANSKVDMANVFEGGGGEEVERYCVIIIFSIHFFDFFRFSTFQKFYLAIKLTKV